MKTLMSTNFDSTQLDKDLHFNDLKRIIQESVANMKIPPTLPSTDASKPLGINRLTLWNAVFTDFQVAITMPIFEFFLLIIRRYVINQTSTHRFCFELAFLYIDLPEEFNALVRHFPVQYQTALVIASQEIYKRLPTSDVSAETVRLVNSFRMTNERLFPEFKKYISQRKANEISEDAFFKKMNFLLTWEQFDILLACQSPKVRLHYALKYKNPYPLITIDWKNLALPFEFLQAIADIDGLENAQALISNDIEFLLSESI